MKAKNSDWYKNIWTMDIKNESWVEDTENQVDFIIKTLNLCGKERILDLACGFGRHSLALSRRGYSVVGVDITKEYITDATNVANQEFLDVQFIHSDIREVNFINEFDVVLNLADGAIGYLENEEENLKIFNIISQALKTGGKHIMDVCNAEHAESYFPKRSWENGKKALALSVFDWDKEKKRMIYKGFNLPYGEPVKMPEILSGDSIRLYSAEELREIFGKRGMKIIDTFSDFYGKQATEKELQIIVYSEKQ